MEQADPYVKFLSDPTVAQTARSLGQRMFRFFEKFSKLFLDTVLKSHLDSLYSPSLEALLMQLEYKRVESEGNVCSKRIFKFFRCDDCERASGIDGEILATCFCELCFVHGNHIGHNFRVMESTNAVCDCGDEDLLVKTSFCRYHKGSSHTKAGKLSSSEESLFLAEMEFLFYLFYALAPLRNNILDQHRKKQIFGLCLVNKITALIDRSYQNQLVFAKFLQKEVLVDKSEKKKMIKLILCVGALFPVFEEAFCNKLLLRLAGNKHVKEMIFTLIFERVTDSMSFLRPTQSLTKIAFQFFNSSKVLSKMISSGKLPPLMINYEKFSNFSEKELAYKCLYHFYHLILETKQARNVLYEILNRGSICKLFNYVKLREERQYRTSILALGSSYLATLLSMMKTINNSQYKKELLGKIIKETYQYILTKMPSLCLSAERTLALALFSYFDYLSENIYDVDDEEILRLFGEADEYQFSDNLKLMLEKYLYIFKTDNFHQYRKEVLNQCEVAGYSKMTISVDHLYARFLLMLLIKVEKPYYGVPIAPLESFLTTRQGNIEQLRIMYQQNEVQRMEETMMGLLYEITLMVSNFIYLGQSSICEVAVADYFGKREETEIFNIYRLLVYMNHDLSPKEFKTKAEKYLKNPNLIEKFIKEELSVYRQTIKNGQVPENAYNLSYNSFFVTPTSFKEYNNLYYLKLKSRKRTELSRFLFSEAAMKQILNIFRWMFDVYKRLLEENNLSYSKVIILNTIETLGMLYLQTLSSQAKEMLDQIIANPEMMSLTVGQEYYKQAIQLYVSNQEKLKQQEAISLLKQQEMKRNQLLRNKKLQKIKQLKLTQASVLEKVNSLGSLSSVQLSNQNTQTEKICIICYGDSRISPLNYLCSQRFSNFMSKTVYGENFPITLITTCGHLIHNQCLNTSLRPNAFGIVFSDCFLCKTQFNLLIPIYVNPTNQDVVNTLVGMKLQEEGTVQDYSNKIKLLLQVNLRSCRFQMRLVISMVYELCGYSLFYQNYFSNKILPVLTELFKILKLTIFSASDWQFAENHFKNQKSNLKFTFNVIRFLLTCKQKKIPKEEINQWLKEATEEETRSHLHAPKQQKQHAVMLINIITFIYSGGEEKIKELQVIEGCQQPGKVFKLPTDLVDLNGMVGVCFCKKVTSKIIICYMCSQKFCDCCRDRTKKHLQEHFGEGVFIKIEKGECCYQHTDYSLQMSPLYLDYVGDPVPSSIVFPKRGKYLLSKQRKAAIVDDMLNNRIGLKVADVLMHRDRCEVQ